MNESLQAKNSTTEPESEGHIVRILLLIIIAFLILTYLHALTKMVAREQNFGDFANYYFFSKLLHEGADVYSLTSDERDKLKELSDIPVHIAGYPSYSSFFFAVFYPFTTLPFWISLGLWLILNHIALLLCVRMLVRFLKRNGVSSFLSMATTTVVVFASQPLWENFNLGQSNILIFLLILLIFEWHNTKPIISGICLSLILTMKPQFGVLFIFFLVRQNYRVSVATLLSYIGLQIIAVAMFGFSIEFSYGQQLVGGLITDSTRIIQFNLLSLRDFFIRLFFSGRLELVSVPAYIISSVLLLFFTFKTAAGSKRTDFSVTYSLALCLILLISPITEEHHLVLTGLPMIVAISRVRGNLLLTGLLVVSFVLINVRYSFVSFGVFDTGLPSILAFGKTFGVFVLWLTLMMIVDDFNKLKSKANGE